MFSIILPTGLIDLLVVDAAVKKHRFPKDGKNATSPVLNHKFCARPLSNCYW